MLEITQNLESVMGPAARDYPLYVIASGVVAVAVGLLVWLGGLGFKRVLIAIAGAACGFAFGYFAIGWSIISAIVLAGVVAVVSAIFERVFIALLMAILMAGLGFVVLVGPHISTKNVQTEPEIQEATANSDESMDQPASYLEELGGRVESACSEVPVYQWIILALLTLIFFGLGFVFRRLAGAAGFSVLGTLLISAGMIVLLLYKGATPLSWVAYRPSMYASIFAGMMAFGTVEQLLFCRGGLVKPAKKEKAVGDDVGAGKIKKRRIKEV